MELLEKFKKNDFDKNGDKSWKTFADFIDSITYFLNENSQTKYLVPYIEKLFKSNNPNDCHINFVVKKLFENQDLKEALDNFFKKLYPINCIRSELGKNHPQALKLFDEGNESFECKNYLEALKYYSEAILLAEHETSDRLLPKLYEKRSIVFYHLQKYLDRVLDLQELIHNHEHGFPLADIYLRMVKATVSSMDSTELDLLKKICADCDQEKIRSCLSSNQKKLMEESLQKIQSFLKSKAIEKSENSSKDLNEIEFDFDLGNQKHPLIKGASKKLKIKIINNEKERGYVAQEDIQQGEYLFVERPFVMHYFPEIYDTHCRNCLRFLCETESDVESSVNAILSFNSFVPCNSCNKFKFCNRKCLTEALNSFHQNECQCFMHSLEDQMGIGYLPARILCAADYQMILEKTNRLIQYVDDDLSSSLNIPFFNETNLLPLNGDYADILKLMTHNDQHDIQTKICFILASFFLNACFVNMKFFQQKPNKPNELGLILLFVHHFQQLSTNFITIFDQNYDEKTDSLKELPIGIGVYPNIALFNHSCDPDLIPIYVGSKILLKANRIIESGKEVCFNYGPTYHNMCYVQRQKWLKEHYFFQCQCEACLDRKENYSNALLCTVCYGPAFILTDYDESDKNISSEKDPILLCRNGHKIIELEPILKKIQIGLENLNCGQKYFEDNNFIHALISYHDADLAFTDSLYCLNYMWIQAKSQQVTCYLKLGHYDRAAICSEHLVKSYQKYPKNQELLIPNLREHIRLIKILMLLADEKELSPSQINDNINNSNEAQSHFNRIKILCDFCLKNKEFLSPDNIEYVQNIVKQL